MCIPKLLVSFVFVSDILKAQHLTLGKHIANNVNINPSFLISSLISHLSYAHKVREK